MSDEGTKLPKNWEHGQVDPALPELNPGIRRTVRLLRQNGFNTIDSGDGETHDHTCDRDESYVSINTLSVVHLYQEAMRLYELLRHWKIPVGPMGTEGMVWIQASYDPANGSAIIDIINIHDRLLPERL